MKHLSLSSKSNTLKNLSVIISSAKILPLVNFKIRDYKINKEQIVNEIQEKFKENIIVRSSSLNEDNISSSNAGAYDSIRDVNINIREDIEYAIKRVIDSYGSDANPEDGVFVQEMLKNVTMSGVIFSADIDTLSSYYSINYDESGSSDSVTSGNTNNLKSLIVFKEYANIKDIRIKKIIEATKECESIFNNNFLDIEFAFSYNELYLFQVRSISTINKDNLSSLDLSKSLYKLYKKIEKLNTKHPNLLGKKTIFGVMPDWNPAEIIGIRPKRLALSLYKELITDETWAYQRDNYGYRNLRSHPLLISFLGVPFIDVRISFNSFIPKVLDNTISTKLVNYYLDELSKNIYFHDKIEFEIIYSCYYFGIEKKIYKLQNSGFSLDEIEKIKTSLINLTNNIIDNSNGLYKKDLEKIEKLETKLLDITSSNLSLIDKIYWLIKDVKRYGTLPFAGIARAAFIAMQFLNSFVEVKIITKKEYELFFNNLNTISKKLSNDFYLLSKKEFLDKYGHLRPGTYDITSLRYDEGYDTYFGKTSSNIKTKIEFEFSDKQKKEITDLIVENSLNTDCESLLLFIQKAIEGREYAKFIFTKHLSQIMIYIEEFGNKFGLSRNELAYLDIQTILNMYSTLDNRDVVDILNVDIKKNKEFYNYVKAVKLPNVILNADDIYMFNVDEGAGNFITLKKIKSKVIYERNIDSFDLSEKIVCIKSADPGYDYLFSRNIAGLITCYGGSNSHMAIRCAELGIPAVIGCGEKLFKSYVESNVLEIDAENKQVRILS
ncbi:MAG: PEP-utilizing enzyme [Arcobacter sp.]|uniref:PEP-utilizing enzyme n=1 Tax=Arcobacter sp. TaxID=1872629 RepID=UPI003C752D4C